jgi:N-acyl-D-amino-acid deacylase
MADSPHFDLVIRNGLVIDGTGSAPFKADVAVRDGKIARIGAIDGTGAEELDAKGCIVTPGFIDVHTHYDGHVTWTDRLVPSSNHGVTTAVMGNCGVGFAPARPTDHETMIELMEGVEDIPGVVMREGIPWAWESFPEYLDFIEKRQYDMDVAAYFPHAPLRVYVMGERALRREKATGEDIAEMRRLAKEAVEAGAIGFATSRTINHKSIRGENIPTYTSAEEELKGIAQGLEDAGSGVMQLISDFENPHEEFAMIRRVAEGNDRRLTFSLLQSMDAPNKWRQVLANAEQAAAEGMRVTAQICGRPVGVLSGLELSTNPFTFCPSYKVIADLPLNERVARLREPEVRAQITAEYPATSWEPISNAMAAAQVMFPVGDNLEYMPQLSENMVALAERAGVPVAQYLYDYLLEYDGQSIIYQPFLNYYEGTADAIETMLRSAVTVPGLGDGGAHCSAICDASLPTYLLMRWTGADDGPLSLPAMVKSLTADCAAAVELNDRGRLVEGLKADINVIDVDNLTLQRPEMVYDLPLGGGRLNQRSSGYVVTIVSGQVTYRNGAATGALPGRLVRGTRPDGKSACKAALAAA